VLPDTVPFDKVKPAIPCVLFAGLPSSDTNPLGVPVPDCGFTVTLKLTVCPCVIVVGVKVVTVVADGSNETELHFVTRLSTFTEPSPVARS
jgi:hypothetical protein